MKCIQQVSAHRENTQPHPKRVADVTTKLLFVCYNHYAASEAKAPQAVAAVRSKPHRISEGYRAATQENSVLRLGFGCFLLQFFSQCQWGQWDRNEQPRQQVGPWDNFCPSHLTRQSHEMWH